MQECKNDRLKNGTNRNARIQKYKNAPGLLWEPDWIWADEDLAMSCQKKKSSN